MQGIEAIVKRKRVALTFTRHIVLAHLCLLELHLVIIHLVLKLCVVRTTGCILIGAAEHHAETVVKEAVAPGSPQVPAGLGTDRRITHAAAEVEHAAVRRLLGHEVDGTANGVAVHVGRHHLIHLNGLHHVGGDEVELHITRVALGRRQAVAVHGDGGKVGARAAHLTEASLALVVLHIDTADTLQGIAYVGVGEFTDLIGRHHVRHTHAALLLLQGAALCCKGTCHHGLIERAFLAHHQTYHLQALVGTDGHFLISRRITHIRHLDGVRAGLDARKRVKATLVAEGAHTQLLNLNSSTGQGVFLHVRHLSAHQTSVGVSHPRTSPHSSSQGRCQQGGLPPASRCVVLLHTCYIYKGVNLFEIVLSGSSLLEDHRNLSVSGCKSRSTVLQLCCNAVTLALHLKREKLARNVKSQRCHLPPPRPK